MYIADELLSIDHNPHYVKRYLRLVDSIKSKQIDHSQKAHKHHILPSSIFPQFKDLQQFPDNALLCTVRQHLILHIVLYKAIKSPKMATAVAFMLDIKSNGYDVNWRQTNTKFVSQLIALSDKSKGDSNVGKLWWTDDNTELYEFIENVPNGFWRGRLKKAKANCSVCNKLVSPVSRYHWESCGQKYMWINNGIRSKFIKVIDKLPYPWKRGRLGFKMFNTDRSGENNSFYGKRHTEETKQVIREKNIKASKQNSNSHNSMSGKIFITNGIINAVVESGTEPPTGWRFGSTQNNKPRVWVTDGQTEILLQTNQIVPDGFKPGRKPKTSIWITNGEIEMKVSSLEDLKHGFRLGRTKKTRKQ